MRKVSNSGDSSYFSASSNAAALGSGVSRIMVLPFDLSGKCAEQGIGNFRFIREKGPDLVAFMALADNAVALDMTIFDKGKAAACFQHGGGPGLQELRAFSRKEALVIITYTGKKAMTKWRKNADPWACRTLRCRHAGCSGRPT